MDQLANIATTAAVYYIAALGLFMMLNVMGVVNLAHGAFLTVGGYVAVAMEVLGLPFWLALPLAAVVGVILGSVVELGMIRRLYDRPLDTILATWGLAIVITQVIGILFGREGQFVPVPFADSPVTILGADVATYRLGILALAAAVFVALSALTRFTYAGVVARAVVMNPRLARSLGINTSAVNFITFVTASAIATFSGAVIAPLGSVDPNLGFPYVIVSFMVVLVAGVSLNGMVASSLLIAAGTTLASFYFATVAGVVVLVVLPVLVLRFLPAGLVDLRSAAWVRRIALARRAS